MNVISESTAKSYVSNIELPFKPRSPLEEVEAPASFDFAAAKSQTVLVGSDIVSFVRGVTPERCGDILRSSLLAQLAAKKRVPDPKRIYDWYNEYVNVLTNIGWVIQDWGFSTYSESSKDFLAHEAILRVATALLGPGAAALTLVEATLKALQSMSADNPWITLFNRESQSANTARFQIMLAEQGSNDQFLVTFMAFGLEATSQLTQVLFFKFLSNDVTFKHYAGKVTIDSSVLESVRDLINKKVSRFAQEYVKEMPDL